MTCQETMDLMQRSLDEELDASEAARLTVHLNGCPGCADLYQKLQRLNQELLDLPKVQPPYSIVDSILPQLEGAGGFAEPSAAREMPNRPEPVALELEAYRRRRSFISWRMVSGVTAAGIVLGVLLFQGAPGRVEKNSAADQMLLQQSSGVVSTQATPTATEAAAGSPVAPNAAASGTSDSDAARAEVSIASPPPDEPISISTREGSAAVRTEAPPHGGREVSAASDRSASSLEPEEAGSQANGAAAGSLSGAETAASPEPEQQRRDEAAASASPTEAGTMYGIASIGSPEPSGPSEEPAAKQRPSGEPESTPSPEESPDMGIRSLLPEVSPEPGPGPLMSLDGRYSARVESGVVLITDAEGKLWFQSAYHADSGMETLLLGWMEDGSLTYLIRSADGTAAVHRIQADAKQETVE